jgi:hypothetical protein
MAITLDPMMNVDNGPRSNGSINSNLAIGIFCDMILIGKRPYEVLVKWQFRFVRLVIWQFSFLL